MSMDGHEPRTEMRRKKRRAPRPVTRESLEKSAHFYLQRYDATQEHLRRVLERKAMRAPRPEEADEDGVERVQQWIDEIVQRCVELRLVDDRRYAEGLARRLQRQGHSHRASWHKLRQKGVPEALIEEQLGTTAEGDHELHAASRLARKRRLGPWRNESQRAERRQRDLGALARAGFNRGIATRVIDAESPDDLPTDGPRMSFD